VTGDQQRPSARSRATDNAWCGGEAGVEIGIVDRDVHAHGPRHDNRFGDDVLEVRPREASGLRVVNGGEGVSRKHVEVDVQPPRLWAAGQRLCPKRPATERAPMASMSCRSRAATSTTSSAAIRGSSASNSGHRQTQREAELHVCGLARRRQRRRVRVLVPVHEEQTEAPIAVASAREAAESRGQSPPMTTGRQPSARTRPTAERTPVTIAAKPVGSMMPVAASRCGRGGSTGDIPVVGAGREGIGEASVTQHAGSAGNPVGPPKGVRRPADQTEIRLGGDKDRANADFINVIANWVRRLAKML
jgi:hypothetical protein